MKSLISTPISFILIQFISFAQSPDTMWTKTFGGIGGDIGTVGIETIDNGYVIGGRYDWYQSYVIRLNHMGDSLWTSTSNYLHNPEEWVLPNLYEINPNHYVMRYNGSSQGLIMLKSNGDSIQYYELNSPPRQGPFITHMCKTNDNNYVLSYYGIIVHAGGGLQKVDEFAVEVWWKWYWGFQIKFFIPTEDDGFAIVGEKTAYIDWWEGLFLGKTNSFGDTLWTRTLYFDDTTRVYGKGLEQAADGGYLILGNEYYEPYYENPENIRLFRTNEFGDTLWTKKYGGSENDVGEYLTKTPDGGYIIVGSTESFGVGDSDVWLIKLDSLGNTQWTKTIGGTEDDYGNYVQVTSDGGYIVTGSTSSYGQGESDVWVIKLAPDPLLNIEANNDIVISDYRLAQNFPNPFNPITTIKYQVPKLSFITLKVYDVLGSEIVSLVNEEKAVGNYEIGFDASKLPSGVYFYRLQSGGFVETKKMVLMK